MSCEKKNQLRLKKKYWRMDRSFPLFISQNKFKNAEKLCTDFEIPKYVRILKKYFLRALGLKQITNAECPVI